MSLIRVKGKGQVTIPSDVRKSLDLEQGDVLEAEVWNGRIVLTPNVVLDRDALKAIDEGLADFDAVEIEGPFEGIASFKEHIRNSS